MLTRKLEVEDVVSCIVVQCCICACTIYVGVYLYYSLLACKVVTSVRHA
jgi:hypothetical protein